MRGFKIGAAVLALVMGVLAAAPANAHAGLLFVANLDRAPHGSSLLANSTSPFEFSRNTR
jgi:hypothetical protein